MLFWLQTCGTVQDLLTWQTNLTLHLSTCSFGRFFFLSYHVFKSDFHVATYNLSNFLSHSSLPDFLEVSDSFQGQFGYFFAGVYVVFSMFFFLPDTNVESPNSHPLIVSSPCTDMYCWVLIKQVSMVIKTASNSSKKYYSMVINEHLFFISLLSSCFMPNTCSFLLCGERWF